MSKINKKKIAGLVGYTILLNPITYKKIILLADVHDGVKYCSQDHTFIDTVLNKYLDDENFKVLLEEVSRKGLELVELWPDAKHTQRLKQWFLKNETKIIPIDIRPYLVPFSHQKYNLKMISDEEKNMKMEKYLKTLSSLLNLTNKPSYKGLFFIKDILEGLKNKKSCQGIVKMYKLLQKKYNNLISQINLKNTFEETILKNDSWFINLEELKLNIMDWYTVILLLGNNNYICHLGLAHYLNVIKVLQVNFNFEILIQQGLNKFTDNFPICSCIEI